MTLPKAYFDIDTLTAKIGNTYKGYEVLQCHRVPPFTKILQERESLGDGWYGEEREVEKLFDDYFVIVRDSIPIGVLYRPIKGSKTDIMPLWYKYYPEVENFISSLSLKSTI